LAYRKIQEEALRTYFFTYGQFYEAMGLDELAAMFDLPRPSVYSLVSKMIINEELHGALDQPTGTLILHRTEPSRLQHLALQYSDKLAGLVESNERQMMNRTGGLDKFEQRADRGGRGGRLFQQGDRRDARPYGQRQFQVCF
jgi:translation initiation factor 3 subunit C